MINTHTTVHGAIQCRLLTLVTHWHMMTETSTAANHNCVCTEEKFSVLCTNIANHGNIPVMTGK